MAEFNKNTYHDQVNNINTLKLRQMQNTLPKFLRDFFLGIKDTTSTRTRLAYAYDLRIFFEFIKANNPQYKNKKINEFNIEILEEITAQDIVEYMDYLSYYENEEGDIQTNDERGKQRKLASLRSMYNYFYKMELISKNPAALVDFPKLHKKEIIRLDPNEVKDLLNNIENGEGLTKNSSNTRIKQRFVTLQSLLFCLVPEYEFLNVLVLIKIILILRIMVY